MRPYLVNRSTPSGRYNFSKGFSGLSGDANSGNGFATLLLGTRSLPRTGEKSTAEPNALTLGVVWRQR